MLHLLNSLNYSPPNIEKIKYNNIEVISNDNGYFYLLIDGHQWMAYNINTHLEAYEVYSHWRLAEGHVVVTGMGFGARESWILTKPQVTKLTIIERSNDLIQYHYHKKSPFLLDSRVEIINCDASEYKGSCDVLLLDHYELEDYMVILGNVKKIHDNIDCKKMWVWPLEAIIMHSRRWFSFEEKRYISKFEAYNRLKSNGDFSKFPELTQEDVNLFCMMFNSKLFSKSEIMIDKFLNDTNEIWRMI